MRHDSRLGLLKAYFGRGPFCGLAVLFALFPAGTAHGVNCTAATSGTTLATAIDEANAGICDTINIQNNITLVSQNLPVIDRIGATITIQGSGATRTLGGSDDSRLIAVLNGNLTVQDLVIQDGLAEGGDGGGDDGGGGGGGLGAGGGLFVGANAQVTVRNVAFSSNTAQGGNGGSTTFTITNSGGGAGGGGINGGDGGGGVGAETAGGKGGGGGFGASGGTPDPTQNNGYGGAGGGGGGNNATAGATSGPGYAGGAGGPGDGGAGSPGTQGQQGIDASPGTGYGGGGGGGATGQPFQPTGSGGDGGPLGGGGGGGGATNQTDPGHGGDGGFGGGAGGGGMSLTNTVPQGGDGGTGGFGAGGAGGGHGLQAAQGNGGAGGYLGGAGGGGNSSISFESGGGGGGGAGLGGGIFVQNGGSLLIGEGVTFTGNAANGGAGGTTDGGVNDGVAGSAGTGVGANVYAIDGAAGLGSNAAVGFNVSTAQTLTVTNNNLLQAGYSGDLTKDGGGDLTLNTTAPITSGDWTVANGTLRGTTTNLTGNIANAGTVEFNQTATGTHMGNITGTGGVTKTGTGNVTLGGANTYSGDTTVDQGTLTVNGSGIGDTSRVVLLNPGTLSVGAAGETVGSLEGTGNASTAGTLSVGGNGQTTTYSGTLAGAGGLVKNGTGTMTLTGTNTYSGGTAVNAGTLSVDGTLASGVTVNAGGRLQGTGSMGSVASGGTVAPGNSIGTMNVVGNFTLGPGSVLEVELDAAGAADRINVTGNATLDGTLRLLPEPGSYTVGTQYVIIDAASVGGDFDATDLVNPERLGGLTLTVSLTATQLLLLLEQGAFQELATDGVEGEVARHIDDIRGTAAGDLADVISALEVLPVGQLDEALRMLAPQYLDAIPRMRQSFHRLLMAGVSHHLGGQPAPVIPVNTAPATTSTAAGDALSTSTANALQFFETGSRASLKKKLLAVARQLEGGVPLLDVGGRNVALWAKGFGEFGHRKDAYQFLGYNYTNYGGVIGLGFKPTEKTVAGVFASANQSDVVFVRGRGESDSLTVGGGGYLGWIPYDGVALNLKGWLGSTRQRNTRTVRYSNVDRRARSKTDILAGGVEAQGSFAHKIGEVRHTLFSNLGYLYGNRQAFTETGADSINLRVAGDTDGDLTFAFGTAFGVGFETGLGTVSTDTGVAFTAVLPLDDRSINASFEGQSPFTIGGDSSAQFGVSPRVGVRLETEKAPAFFSRYQGQFEKNFMAHGMNLGMDWRF